jgi:hypothetical protein
VFIKQACRQSFVHFAPQAPLNSLLPAANLAFSEKKRHFTQKSRQPCRLRGKELEFRGF